MGFEFAVDAFEVLVDGSRREEQPGGDPCWGQAVVKQVEYHAFAVGESANGPCVGGEP